MASESCGRHPDGLSYPMSTQREMDWLEKVLTVSALRKIEAACERSCKSKVRMDYAEWRRSVCLTLPEPGRVETFFVSQKLHVTGRDGASRRDRLSLFLLYRVRIQLGATWGRAGRDERSQNAYNMTRCSCPGSPRG